MHTSRLPSLRVSSWEAVRELGKFLAGAGYDFAHIGGELDLGDLPHGNGKNRQTLRYKTRGATPLHALAALFYAGEAVDTRHCRETLPNDVVGTFIETGMVEELGGALHPVCTLIPFRNRIIACDGGALRKGSGAVVLGPSASTDLVSRFSVRGPSAATLDFGTGSGFLALEAAVYSESVVATDVNPRAISFANFNAALNDVRNMTAIEGDALTPVEGREFTRIIANPPFFLTPVRQYTYSDSPMELDGFCRMLAREAPRHLTEGGFFQMTAEWVEIKGQPWPARLKQWMEGVPCDVMAISTAQYTPTHYTEMRLAESYDLTGTIPEGAMEQRMAYFEERNVEVIVGGVITMRKRSGPNWFVVLPCESSGFRGAAIIRRFAALDYLSSHSEADILNSHYRVADGVELLERKVIGPNGWVTDATRMNNSSGLGDTLRLDEAVTKFIPLFDGKRTVAEIADLVLASLSWPVEVAHQRSIALTRRLLQSGFLWAGE
jgi:methylase of polypeptide subunit release factors